MLTFNFREYARFHNELPGDAAEAFGVAYELVQVSLNMESKATRQREVPALREAMTRFKKDTTTIVTLDEETDITIPEGVICVAPAWKWLLG